MILLAILSAVLALTLVATVAFFADQIARTLEAIGSNEPSTGGSRGEHPSYLSRIWFGVRAIERQTASLSEVEQLNSSLEKLATDLQDAADSLAAARGALERQGG
jgi:hypothetical protein